MPSNNSAKKYVKAKRYLKSLVKGYLKRDLFENLQAYCMFIGYQRSGHSLIGALLDAHPNIIVGMEVDVLDLLEKGYNRNQILYCLLDKSIYFTQTLKNVWTDYSYEVPGSYQGKFTQIKIMGDKKGGKSTLRLNDKEALLDELELKLRCPVKILHIIRNPFDNITTMVKRHLTEGKNFDRALMEEKINLYFRKAEINATLCRTKREQILDIYHENFLQQPIEILRQIVNFLELTPSKDYLHSCSQIVYNHPHHSRFDMDWPDDLKAYVQTKILEYPFLKHYIFDHE